jgi:hypothetical protein
MLSYKAAQSTVLHLREAVEQTKALFEGAEEEYVRAAHRMQDPGLTHPDGSLRHALTIYRFTLNAYQLALGQYNQYLIQEGGTSFSKAYGLIS